MTDLVPIPHTGEALDLSGPDGHLAEMYDRIRDMEAQCKEARNLIRDEMLRRMDASAAWTRRADGWEVKAPSPAPVVEWDAQALLRELTVLWGDGVITAEAMDAAVEVVTELKVRSRGVNAIRKLGDEVRVRVDACSREVERARNITVRRAA